MSSEILKGIFVTLRLAKITFRSEILSSQFLNKSGRCVLKGGVSWSGILRVKYWVIQNSLLLPVLNFENHRL